MKDYTGKTFGFWTVIRYYDCPSSKNHRWLCRCKCGVKRPVTIHHLTFGRSKSCGCGVNKIGGEKHGLVGTRLYKSWDSMKERCFNPNNSSYNSYGGRGITMCSILLQSPANLIAVVGDHPGKGWSIDRKDTNGHYSCGSCAQCLKDGWLMNLRWATPKQQCRNRRNNRLACIDGRTLTAAELAEIAGITNSAMLGRLNRWETGHTLLSPPHERKKICVQADTIVAP